MKRIYLALALIGAMVTGVQAQDYIDLEAVIEGFEGTWVICESTDIDTNIGYWGIRNNGPNAVLVDDRIWLKVPHTSDTFGVNTISGYTLQRDVIAGEFVIAFSNFPASGITYLLNIENYEGRDSNSTWADYFVHKNDLIDGQEYGFFIYAHNIGDGDAQPIAEDTVRNNLAYRPIIWCGDATSTKELLTGQKNEQLKTYPNPVTDQINFKYDFLKTADASVSIMDITGRTVLTKDLGKNVQGIQSFNIDCSVLPAGSYILEFQTDGKRAISKFNIRK